MLWRLSLLLLVCVGIGRLSAQNLSDVEIHGFVIQGFLFSSHNNYLTMQSSAGSLQWTDAAVSFSDPLTNSLRVGIQLHMYQLGQLGGPNLHVDWASGDYRINDHLGFRAGKVKTVMGLFNDSQDIDAIFLWTLLPQCSYPVDNEGFFLAHVGGEVYGSLPIGERGGSLRYDGYAGESNLPLDGGYIKQLQDAGVLFTTSPGGKTYGGDLRWETPWKGFLVGFSPMVLAEDGAAPGGSLHVPSSVMTAQYAQYTRRKFSVAGEYDRAPFNEVLTVGQTIMPMPMDMRSWYIMASYRLTRKLQGGSYYSHYINKAMNTALPANYAKDWVVSGRYDFNAYFYGKVEGHFLRGNGIGLYASTNPNGLTPNSNMLAAKIGFSF